MANWSDAMKMGGILNGLVFGTILLACGQWAGAQAVKATLLGTVSDQSGAVIPDCAVTIREESTGATYTAHSNGSGNYEFPDLSPGKWDVTAQHGGFKSTESTGVPVAVNTTVRVNLTMQPGSVSQNVIVSASQRPLLQTDRADVSANIGTKQVENLPLGNNRNVQALQSLLPGVSAPLYIHTSFANPQQAQSFHVNGQSVMSSSLELEGIDDNERTGQLDVYIPPAAAIQALDVTTSNYEAEFGRALGAVTNIILKSGSNQFHGSAYEYNEISALEAKNYFDSGPKSKQVNNYFGATIGGPIIKDRTFFFADILRSTNHAQNFNLVSLPTAAYRSGDFSSSPSAVYDPSTGTGTGTGRKQFIYNGNKNVISPGRINPVSAALLALVPLPNVPGNTTLVNNYQANLNSYQDTTSYDIKLDQRLGERDSLSYRYSHDSVDTYQQPLFGMAGGPGPSGGAQGTGRYNLWNTAVEYVHPFSSNLLTEVRFGIDHYLNSIRQSDFGTNADTGIGIPGANTSPFTSGLSQINISGFSGPMLGYYFAYPVDHAETNINFVNNWTKIIGNHTTKWGAEVRRLRDDQTGSLQYDPRGQYSFSYGQTAVPGEKTSSANSVASFLIDSPNGVDQQSVLGAQTWRQTLYFGFLQDQWEATKKLTLIYGLRWELYPPSTPRATGGFSDYFPDSNTLQVAGYGKIPKDMGMQTNYKDFAPRLGFAYRAAEGTVVRAGFGISYSPWLDNRYTYGNYPVQQNSSFAGVNSYSPALLGDGTTATFQAGFPPVVPATIPANGIITNAPRSSSYYVVNLKYKDPYVMSYNFTVEQALRHGFTFDIGYVGNEGRQIPQVYNLNAGMVLGAGAKGQPQYVTLKRTASTNFFYKPVTSSYNSLQTRLRKRFANGFLLTSSFAFQKALGYEDSSGAIASAKFYVDYHRNYSVLAYNQKETYAQSVVYELPFGPNKRFLNHGLSSLLAGGWELSAIGSASSGFPLTFTAAGTSLNAPSNTQVANQVAAFRVLHGIGTGNPWFDTSAFSQPTTAAYGNTGINIYSGPTHFGLDSSIFRSFPIRERANLSLRMDAFHVTNTPVFSSPSTAVDSTQFGIVSGASGSRVIQLAAQVTF